MFETIGRLNGSKQLLKEGKFDMVPDLKFFLDMPSKGDWIAGNYVTPIRGDIDAEHMRGIRAVIAGQMGVKAILDGLQNRMKPLLDDSPR